jgi:hypothetical protein
LSTHTKRLNPVEHLWEDLKARIDVLDRRIRSSLARLQDHIADIVRRYTDETIASLTGYAYLVEAVRAHSLDIIGFNQS